MSTPQFKVSFKEFEQVATEFYKNKVYQTQRFGQAFWNQFGQGTDATLFYETDVAKARAHIFANYIQF